MKRTLALASAAALTALIGAAAPAQASNGDIRYIKCGDAIVFQTERGIVAGGGPKVGIPAPLNCDHYFQIIGAIGKPQGG
jgi:hypothetical protein